MSKKKKTIPLPELTAGIMAVDTHCHLDMAAYDPDRQAVIDQARTAGVTRMLTIGIDLASSRKAIELAGKHHGIFATVGVHPHNVGTLDQQGYDEIASLATRPEVVAYGEIGLDFVKEYAPAAVQLEHFKRQVELAKVLNLPLIIHDREAHDQTLTILEKAAPFPAGGVMHCFSGDCNLADRVMALGFHISIPGVVTFNKADTLQEAVRHVPISSLLLETDGPFLAPVPRRGKRNQPAYVLYTAQKVAELKNLPLEDVARQTTKNAMGLFRLS